MRRGTKRGHTYHLLAAQRGPRKVFEPFLVTLTVFGFFVCNAKNPSHRRAGDG